jgi:quinol monooxygenase YgiN
MMADTDNSVLTHVTYRPKKGKEEEVFELVKKHWPALKALGLSTDEPAKVYRATDKRSGQVYFVEIFSWRDEQASSVAHQTPEVMAIWEPMGPILEGLELARLEPFSDQV